jgi:hypothetical protein
MEKKMTTPKLIVDGLISSVRFIIGKFINHIYWVRTI